MIEAYDRFNKIMNDTKESFALYEYLEKRLGPVVDISDLLRWQWAQTISAFDKLIHDLVCAGMLEIFHEIRQPTAAYLNFTIPMATYNRMVNDATYASSAFEQIIIEKNGYKAFQDTGKVSEALALIWGEEHKWQAIAQEMGKSEADVKVEVKNIVTRRNQIVHEGDYAADPMVRQNISKDDVNEVITFVELLAKAIYTLLTNSACV